MLTTACRQLREWHRLSGFPLRVGIMVNVSTRELRSSTFVDRVSRTLRDAGLAGRHLTLEVTESVLVADPELVAERLAEIKTLGVQVAIDDFGSGYSSLQYLQRLPVDVLKIDGSFVAALNEADRSSALLGVALEMGSRLGMRTVAEGVEDAVQLRHLTRIGCRFAQGYLFSRPVDAARVPDLVARCCDTDGTTAMADVPSDSEPAMSRIGPVARAR